MKKQLLAIKFFVFFKELLNLKYRNACFENKGAAIPKKNSREQFPVILNETPSLTDHVFRDSQNPFPDLETDTPASTLPSVEEVIEKYRDLIFEHVSRRIAFFFQQLICCFQTKLHFEIGQVVSQGASAKKVVLTDQNLASLEFERNAAHSSTLPCLLAYDVEEWELYQAKKTKIPKGWIFLKGTDSYRLWNSTINMPRWINMVDLQIDGASRDQKLRYKTLYLINAAAQGKLDPEEGLELFMKLSIDQVESSYNSRISRTRRKSFPGSGKIKPCNEEMYRLRKELADIKQERDILKKAMAIFSRPRSGN